MAIDLDALAAEIDQTLADSFVTETVMGIIRRHVAPSVPEGAALRDRKGLYIAPCIYCYGENEYCDRCAGEGHLIVDWNDRVAILKEYIEYIGASEGKGGSR